MQFLELTLLFLSDCSILAYALNVFATWAFLRKRLDGLPDCKCNGALLCTMFCMHIAQSVSSLSSLNLQLFLLFSFNGKLYQIIKL